MKMNYEEFMLRFLRPAIFNGEELELDVEFEKASLYHVNINTVRALKMIDGDTACINGRVNFNEGEGNDSKCITIYMSGEELSDFINRFGTRRIKGTIKMMVKHLYAVLEKDNYMGTECEELVGFQLSSII
jgi:hypothetical protein